MLGDGCYGEDWLLVDMLECKLDWNLLGQEKEKEMEWR